MRSDFDFRLVSFLSASESRSGEAIASELGCSRTAVWKHIEALRGLGIAIDAVAGKGYKLLEPLELLDKDRIRAQLGPQARKELKDLVILPNTNSTNSWLQSMPPEKRSGVAVLAECQTAGRGRRGQNWVSPFGRNIYASLGWKFESGVGELGCLPLLVALSACDALDRVGLRGHAIKWPNDILLQGKKLGGCLVEVQGDVNGPCFAILGIGINVRMSGSAPGVTAIDQPWTDVASEQTDVSRNALAGFLLDSLVTRLGKFAVDGFASFHADWKLRDVLAGESIELRLADGIVKGRSAGISERGGLMLQSGAGVREYLAGEARIIKQESTD